MSLKKDKRFQNAKETVWVAYQPSQTSPSAQSKKDDSRPQVRRVSTIDRETLRIMGTIFGGLGVLSTALAFFAWRYQDASLRTPLLIILFFATAAAISHLTISWKRPIGILLIHILVGQTICALNFLYVQGAFAPWWQPYLLLCAAGVMTLVLATQKAFWGLVLTGTYMLHLGLVTGAATSGDWQRFALQAGLIGTSGFLFTRVMSLLSASMTRVHERSVKLRLSKDELEEVNRIKTDFFNNVSHEFRTPITLTVGPIQGLLSGRYGSVAESARQQLKMMATQQQRLLQLINQILDAAKLEAGLAELKASKVDDFNAYVSSRAEQFRPLSEQRGLQLKVALDPAVKGQALYVDREKFDKVLLNLLSNAHKFTKQGSITVSTELRGRMVAVRVSDTGMGIREDQLAHVFDRFKQAEGSSSTEAAGTGLGLALVKEYSNLHGGNVTITSVYGQGTAFEVVLPIGKDHLKPESIVEETAEEAIQELPRTQTFAMATDAVTPVSDDATNAGVSEADASKPCVLYADDHAELRRYVRNLLKEHYRVILAVDGKDGLDKAREHKPVLILSDLMMPEMNGTEFCQKVREDVDLKSTPFVLLTAKAELDDKILGLEVGADDYLAKPFSEAELLARVKNLVALRQQQMRLKRELQAARAIQQSLLPQPLSENGCVVDFLYHPCEELSGDFCDLIHQGNWIYAYVADVTSHGTASAQVTYLLKEIFREAIAKTAQDPSASLQDVMKRAADKYRNYGLEYDVGIQVARLHQTSFAFESLRGSAPSPLKVSGKNDHTVLSVEPGPSLSARKAVSEYTILSTKLQRGDRVYLFTDGCYEFSKDRRVFSLKHLYALLSALPAKNWTKEILDELTAVNKSPAFPDDLTVVRFELSEGADISAKPGLSA